MSKKPYFSVSRTIKSVMEAFGKDKEDYRAIGTFPIAGGFFFFQVLENIGQVFP